MVRGREGSARGRDKRFADPPGISRIFIFRASKGRASWAWALLRGLGALYRGGVTLLKCHVRTPTAEIEKAVKISEDGAEGHKALKKKKREQIKKGDQKASREERLTRNTFGRSALRRP
ncbi:hypothetical protein NDU88_000106 [Pleurodeles waltl]|uniref:Uncharacterized protein n=1 Tax=Pleurodeles waltl TaxID=8319 RepID=A0AAV7N706_PLEWA|nr:hypothetical protein NDU88_000106 [Pleurodeles waltl]